MKVTQEMIEEKAVDALTEGVKPRFVLIDKKSYEQFIESMTPTERYITSSETVDRKPKLTQFHIVGIPLKILEVNQEEDLFEVV